jgi:outer membrane protein assembly factor BamB
MLYAFGPDDGAVRWTFTAADEIRSTPAVDPDGNVYFGCSSGRFYSLDASGAQRWAVDLGADVRSSPAVGRDGTIYVGTEDGRLHAIGP